mgnify:CR=1 FL=1
MADSAELSEATLDQMIRAVRPEWSLLEADPAEEGTDAVYFVTVSTPAGRRECVLKACEFLDAAEFRPEPYLLGLADRRTAIPVPSVVGAVDDHSELPAPFFLMDRCDGAVREGEVRALPTDALDRLARDAGRNIGEVHRIGSFEAFGPVRLARDTGADGGGVSLDGRRLTVAETASGSWRSRFGDFVADYCSGLDDRFAGIEADVRALVDSRLDTLDRTFDAVLGLDDYRLGNLLVDFETGATSAVLDWGNAHTMEAQYNLVLTEQYLSGWPAHDDPRRERVRAALRAGYAETNRLETDDAFGRRRELYLGATRLLPMVCFSLWYGDADSDDAAAIAASHRDAIRDLAD